MRWKDWGCAALSVAMGLFVPTAAHAATASQAYTTPGEHVFVVPPGVHSVQILLVGASGGLGDQGADGGTGATLTGTLAVTPGEPLYAEVGGVGGQGDATGNGLGGFNGGGPGGDNSFIGALVSAGGGGGASDVRAVSACAASDTTCAAAATSVTSLASRLLVAGGGGGGGGGARSTSGHTATGGAGGAGDAPGKTGQSDQLLDLAGAGGGAGTPSAGGAAGTGASLPPAEDPAPGTSGAGGQGGYGSLAGGGGGGGGGINGGGGGGGGSGQAQGTFPNLVFYEPAGGGGGGGASTLPPGPPGASNVSLLPTANPQASATFTWILPVPAGTTLPATAVTSSGAMLNGTVNPNDTPLTNCHFAVSPAPPGGSTISCAQQVGSGGTPVAVTALLLGLNPLTTYTARLVAADAQGTSTGAPVSFTTLRAGLPAPGISKLSVTITRRHGRRRGTIKLRVSQPARLAFTFERSKGKRWMTLKRTMTARVRKAGSVTIGFSPKGLAIGRYRLTVVATNAIGERSGPQRATFTITR